MNIMTVLVKHSMLQFCDTRLRSSNVDQFDSISAAAYNESDHIKTLYIATQIYVANMI